MVQILQLHLRSLPSAAAVVRRGVHSHSLAVHIPEVARILRRRRASAGSGDRLDRGMPWLQSNRNCGVCVFALVEPMERKRQVAEMVVLQMKDLEQVRMPWLCLFCQGASEN